MVLVLTNSVDPGEMLYYATFHLGLHSLPKYLFRRFQNQKGLRRVRCTYFIQLKHLGQHMRFFTVAKAQTSLLKLMCSHARAFIAYTQKVWVKMKGQTKVRPLVLFDISACALKGVFSASAIITKISFTGCNYQNLDIRKPVFGGSDQVRLKPVFQATEKS